MSAQSFGIYGKIREVDEILCTNPDLQQLVREVHPELCFMAWNGRPMPEGKKSRDGARERAALIEKEFGPKAIREVRRLYRRGIVADDDINDAFAALWTAKRIRNGEAQVIPKPVPVDSAGLRMEMWY